ncbi:MAG TPA: hypothetical protein VL651_13700, partial [Bacteroidia bacterium]|nr:hypothetical protein [Bacteroidia bacterium]
MSLAYFISLEMPPMTFGQYIFLIAGILLMFLMAMRNLTAKGNARKIFARIGKEFGIPLTKKESSFLYTPLPEFSGIFQGTKIELFGEDRQIGSRGNSIFYTVVRITIHNPGKIEFTIKPET